MNGIRIVLQAPTYRKPEPVTGSARTTAPPGTGAAWRHILIVALTVIAICMLIGRAAELGRECWRLCERWRSVGVPLRLP